MNVGEKADAFLTMLKLAGEFKGVKVTNIERESIWTSRYAIFIVQFNHAWHHLENQYITFDYHRFQRDFDKAVNKTFPDCEIKHNSTTHEYEILGKGYQEHFDTFRDRLEALAEKSNGWTIFRDKPGASG